MTRQKIRKTIILISFLLFPVTLYYFSPYLIIMGASEGIITGSFIVFSLMLLTSLIFGRAFCSWVCPAGGLQECVMMAHDKRARGGLRNISKYIIWVPWVIIIALLFTTSGGFKSVDFLFQTAGGISVMDPIAYITYYFVLALIVILSFTGGRRGFCHYSCWMAPFMIIGTKLKDALHLPSLRLKAEKDKCVSCKSCTKNCPMSLPVDEMAAKGNMKNTECILCGACIDTCPNKVIRYGWRS